MTQIWLLVTTAVGFAGCSFFSISYHFRTRGAWSDSEVGWMLMVAWSLLGMILGLVLASRIFGMWPGRELVSVVCYTLLALSPWWPVRLMWKATRR